MKRARIGAFALAVAAAGALAATVALTPAQTAAAATSAGSAQAVATPVTSSNGSATLVVDPTTDLADTGASIKVDGKGFGDDPGGLYIAVCPDAGNTPNLAKCVGGPIPGNTSPPGAWAHVVGSGTGVNVANWNDGAFSVTLALPSVGGGSADCVTAKCALYTVSDDGSHPGLNNRVPLTFKAPPSSSSVPATPSSAIVQQVGTPTIAPGATQSVIFSGFKPGEQVNLTLFSDPVTLSPVTADPTGVARADFVVPADFVDGTHRLEAIGAQSGTVGVASFQVLAPTPTPSPTPTPTPTPTPSPSPTTSSASSSASSSSAAPATAVTTSTAAAGDSGGSNWWIWLILALVVLAGLITWFIVYRRNKEAARAEQEKQLADAASREQRTGGYDPMADAPTRVLPPTSPPPGGPPPGADPYGLLSGRDHPYGVDPNAPTRMDSPGPTQQFPPGPTQIIGDPTQTIPPGRGGPGQAPPGQSGPGQPDPSGPPTGRMPGPGPSQPGRGGPQQGGPQQGGPPRWSVPPEFAGDAPGGASGGTPGEEGPTGEPGGHGPTQGPRTRPLEPGAEGDDGPGPPSGGPRR